MQSNLNRSGGGGANAVQISLGINKLKSQIGNLQNQITAQQTIYVKQQQQQNNPNAVPGGGHPANDLFRTPNDLSGLPGTFSDMSLKDNGNPFPSTGSTSQQSRLNQWKLPATPVADKDSDLTDFPRAPGTSSKPAGLGVMDDGYVLYYTETLKALLKCSSCPLRIIDNEAHLIFPTLLCFRYSGYVK